MFARSGMGVWKRYLAGAAGAVAAVAFQPSVHASDGRADGRPMRPLAGASPSYPNCGLRLSIVAYGFDVACLLQPSPMLTGDGRPTSLPVGTLTRRTAAPRTGRARSAPGPLSSTRPRYANPPFLGWLCRLPLSHASRALPVVWSYVRKCNGRRVSA